MISEWTLLIILMVPIVAFGLGAVCISLWQQLRQITNQLVMPLHQADARRHHAAIFQNASR